MRLSTSTNIYFNRPGGVKASIEESMKRCAAAGYKVLDLNFHDCTNFHLPFIGNKHLFWVHNIRRLADSLSIAFSQAHAPFYNFCDGNYPEREKMDHLILRAVDHCQILGISWLVIHAGTDFEAVKRAETSKRKNLAYFLPLVEYAHKKGVGIAVENLWDLNIAPKKRYTADVDELMDFVAEFPVDAVGTCYDIGHGTVMRQDHRQNLLHLGNRLRATHVSDCLNKDSNHLLPFTGRTDWKQVMEALLEIGYQGDFTYEMQNYTAFMPDSFVQSALEYSVSVGTRLIHHTLGEDL